MIQATSKTPTITDIARKLNLSVSSVAAALSESSGNTRVSEKTKERVMAMAQRMNYRSNSSARAMRRSRFDAIGFFAVRKKKSDYSFLECTLDGLSAGTARFSQNIVFVPISDASENNPELPRALTEACVDALIVDNMSRISHKLSMAIESAGKPVVYMNAKQPKNSVYINDVAGGVMMTDYLISKGYKHIAMLAPDLEIEHYSSPDRIYGYTKAMIAAGLSPHVIEGGREDWLDNLKHALQGERPIEAIFCVNDHAALQMQKLLYQMGIRVPEDVAIAGCDGEFIADCSVVPLTTLRVPFRGMAEAAVEMANQLINAAPGARVPSVELLPTLVENASTQRIAH